ncbi:MAG: ribonuclease III [Patescibacteria group bacterium]
MSLKELQAEIGVNFDDQKLLEQLFTHRSYINEVNDRSLEHNERLEFLGDAVLELVVTEYLYSNFPNPEGELTNWRSAVVKGEVLAIVAEKLELGKLLKLSKGEEKSGGRTRTLILANTFEALIGGIYLDKGYDAAKSFITKYIISLLPEVIEKKLYVDPKSHLQELAQQDRGATPDYRVMKDEGPDHDKMFTVGVYVKGELIAQGDGPSKQKAEQAAAAVALTNWSK